jgi:hypothetical protein
MTAGFNLLILKNTKTWHQPWKNKDGTGAGGNKNGYSGPPVAAFSVTHYRRGGLFFGFCVP